MNTQRKTLYDLYTDAQQGNWEQVLFYWHLKPNLAKACSRHQDPTFGWTFLHFAARDGQNAAALMLIRLGANTTLWTCERHSAADLAEQYRHSELANLLGRAAQGQGSLWEPSNDPDLLPSSNLWDEAQERRASESMNVAYGGGIVRIPAGSVYHVDSFERTLIGWHGSFNPPYGMDGESMLE